MGLVDQRNTGGENKCGQAEKVFAVVTLLVGCWRLLKELVLHKKMIVDDRNVPVNKCLCQTETTAFEMQSIFF